MKYKYDVYLIQNNREKKQRLLCISLLLFFTEMNPAAGSPSAEGKRSYLCRNIMLYDNKNIMQ